MPPRIRFILQLFPHLSRSNRRADSAQQICHRFRKSQRSKKTPQCAHTGTRERNSAGPSAAPSPGPRAARQMSGYSAPSQTHAPPEPRPEYDPESAAASPSGAAWGLQSAANRQPEPVSQRARRFNARHRPDSRRRNRLHLRRIHRQMPFRQAPVMAFPSALKSRISIDKIDNGFKSRTSAPAPSRQIISSQRSKPSPIPSQHAGTARNHPLHRLLAR